VTWYRLRCLFLFSVEHNQFACDLVFATIVAKYKNLSIIERAGSARAADQRFRHVYQSPGLATIIVAFNRVKLSKFTIAAEDINFAIHGAAAMIGSTLV